MKDIAPELLEKIKKDFEKKFKKKRDDQSVSRKG